MKRVLFVDDEERALMGFRLALYRLRDQWDMHFFSSAQKALEHLENKGEVDALVTDLVMPHMGGLELLERVKRQHPETLLVAATGGADPKLLLRASDAAHQVIQKPFDSKDLENTLRRAFALRDRLNLPALKEFLNRIDQLPSLPSIYNEISKELHSEEPSMRKIGELIQRDMGLTARVLRLVNSAQMGLRHEVPDPVRAAALLGLEALRGIVLAAAALHNTGRKRPPAGFSFEALWAHSMKVGQYAKTIARAQECPRRVVNDAFTGGLLHDMGQAILAAEIPEPFGQALAHARKHRMPLSSAEQELLGATHGEVGGYVLALWGLPDTLVEALMFHDGPGDWTGDAFSAATAVHVAEALASRDGGKDGESPGLDTGYLERLGLGGQVPQWQELCAAEA